MHADLYINILNNKNKINSKFFFQFKNHIKLLNAHTKNLISSYSY
jgi:hypothetical protein